MIDRKPRDPWAAALRAERLRMGMTQQEFAILLGYAPYRTSVAHIEAGRTVLSGRARARIEAALGRRLIAEEVGMHETEEERAKREIIENIDTDIALQREKHPGKTIDDFDGDVEAFLRYVGGEVER